MRQINNEYAALVLIEILYEKGLINKATYDNIQNNYKLREAAREEKPA
ncbi:MAG: hypothetical protein PHR18_07245 [Oscillospiraceae bacterium]|nr:hypothetical protein [Oscillospiraceae bacterium]